MNNTESTTMNRAALEAANFRGAKLMVAPGYAGGGIVGAGSSPAGLVNLTPVFNVRVLMGTRDITDVIKFEIRQDDANKTRHADSGRRVSR